MSDDEARDAVAGLMARMRARSIDSREVEVQALRIAVARLTTIAQDLARRAVARGDMELDGLDRTLEAASRGEEEALGVPECWPALEVEERGRDFEHEGEREMAREWKTELT